MTVQLEYCTLIGRLKSREVHVSTSHTPHGHTAPTPHTHPHYLCIATTPWQRLMENVLHWQLLIINSEVKKQLQSLTLYHFFAQLCCAQKLGAH